LRSAIPETYLVYPSDLDEVGGGSIVASLLISSVPIVTNTLDLPCSILVTANHLHSTIFNITMTSNRHCTLNALARDEGGWMGEVNDNSLREEDIL
jgi:hypothetical protein